MIDSILTSVKKMLGIAEEDESFDADILMHINTAFMILSQLGVGPSGGFHIEDDSAVWTDYTSDSENLAAVKSYIPQKVKLMFDPPTSSAVLEALKQTANELEFRLSVMAESNNKEEIQNG